MLGGILSFAVAIASLVIGIRRLVYLHRTATGFQDYMPDEIAE